MNSRGPLINQRIRGDTLPIKDRVAMTPTVQPAAAGTHRYRELDRLLERGPEAAEARVTDREDKALTRPMPREAPIVGETDCPSSRGDIGSAAAFGPGVPRQLKCERMPGDC
ncbi:hypothetical protein MSTO_10480 [Mycobacterium stomatepiae]|uniref:Uncharacterized protein n=1 Tax=Mycobacterium stomatepiae TaxID=470076 RepID=A0A7I7Q3F0_9MYCO|nr:hypothetical protein MSTO_10480 [Mycobacterium stomatepiae]